MRRRPPLPLVCGLAIGCSLVFTPGFLLRGGSHPAKSDPGSTHASSAKLVAAYGKLPLSFQPNDGRTDKRVQFLARGSGYTVFLTPDGSTVATADGRGAVRTRLVGASERQSARGERRLAGTVNSLIGSDPHGWRTGISTYGQVRFPSVYPGVDLIYHGRGRQLEHDFVVAPGGDPARIALAIGGAKKLRIDQRGDLIMQTPGGALRSQQPVAYQVVAGKRQHVDAEYRLRDGRVSFELGNYDRNRTLVVDPVLSYSTFVGGSTAPGGDPDFDLTNDIDVDAQGNAYITGWTRSTDFPVVNPAQTFQGGPHTYDTDAFVTKLNATGTAIVYSTYIGGSEDSDYAQGIAVGSDGTAYVVGETDSGGGTLSTADDFPGVGNGRDPTRQQTEGFVTRLAADGGSFIYSSYLGGAGAESADAVAVDANGDAYVTGKSSSATGFPLANQFQAAPVGGADAFLVRIHWNSATSTLSVPYGTLIGGAGTEEGIGVGLDGAGKVYIGGTTDSTDYPTKAGKCVAFPEGGVTPTCADPDPTHTDGFVAKFDTALAGAASLVGSTYWGGSGDDTINDIAVTGQGDIRVVGQTSSSDLYGKDFFSDGLHGAGPDGFISEVSEFFNGGDSFYLGGAGTEEADGIDLDTVNGSSYIVGSTTSTDFPLVNSVRPQQGTGETNTFLVKHKFNLTGGIRIIYSTLFGDPSAYEIATAVAADSAGNAYMTGASEGTGAGLPTTPGAAQTQRAGGMDSFVARFAMTPPVIGSQRPAAQSGSSDATFDFTWPDSGGKTFFCTTVVGGHFDAATPQQCTSPVSYSGLADGEQNFKVAVKDVAGTVSAPTTYTFTVDTSPPAAFALSAPAAGGVVSPRTAFSWQPASDGMTSVASYEVYVDGTKIAVLPASACGADCSVGATADLTDGAHEWYAVAVDAVGNRGESSTRNGFTVSSPPTALLVIAPNPALIGSTITFDGTKSTDNSPLSKFEWDLDGDGSFERDTGTTPTTTATYPRAGSYVVTLRVTDANGATGSTTGTVIVNSASGPSTQFGVTVNKAAKYTNDPDVKLTVVFPGLTSSILVSNDGGFGLPKAFLPITEIPWTLESTGPERLPKTVYVRFLPSVIAGLTFTDDIILDETAPKVSTAAVTAAAASSVSAARAAKAKKWKLKVKASDSNSGVDKVQATSNKKKPGKLLKYKSKLTVTSAKKPVYVRARDRAGNYSKWRKTR